MKETHRNTVTLVLGGARSGKSRYAQQLGERAGKVVFIATAHAGAHAGGNDAEMRQKIQCHREERPQHWPTVEEPLELGAAIEQHGPSADTDADTGTDTDLLLIDCLTLFAANLLEVCESSPGEIARRVDHLCHALAISPCAVVLVSNEVGSGIVPAYASGRKYRDLLGEINQKVAQVADEAVLMVAGLPLFLKNKPTPA
jgi:adenosylcobinamide kinase/adenosylcobinamide-phosphate guanylyltransferase